jgi:hypothetical protein
MRSGSDGAVGPATRDEPLHAYSLLRPRSDIRHNSALRDVLRAHDSIRGEEGSPSFPRRGFFVPHTASSPSRLPTSSVSDGGGTPIVVRTAQRNATQRGPDEGAGCGVAPSDIGVAASDIGVAPSDVYARRPRAVVSGDFDSVHPLLT